MPKKRRQQTRFTKPQSTPPPSLASSRTQDANENEDRTRSVNDLLHDLRRAAVLSNHGGNSNSGSCSGSTGSQVSEPIPAVSAAVHPSPSLPPSLRQILQLPEPPPPLPPRSRRLFDSRGRRLPPGPAAPRSWLSPQPRIAAPATASRAEYANRVIPNLAGVYAPARGSLVDTCLISLAVNWEFQRHYNKHWLFQLPDHLRIALIRYVGLWSPAGVSAADLRTILLPPPPLASDDDWLESGGGGGGGGGGETVLPLDLNNDVISLDLVGSLGRSIELKELSDLLSPRRLSLYVSATKTKRLEGASPASAPVLETAGDPADVLPESWDAPEIGPSRALPQILLPNLTRLSLAALPGLSQRMSWRQLLALSTHMPTLTHLSLAYWPPPTITPRAGAVGAVVDSPSGPVQYGGTGFYSHSLDHDWHEAVSVLRRLSRNLYGLEFLDLTGCGPWANALCHSTSDERDSVDWVGAWGKVRTVVLRSGLQTREPKWTTEPGPHGHTNTYDLATHIEKHIVALRQGRGCFIEVIKDSTRPVD